LNDSTNKNKRMFSIFNLNVPINSKQISMNECNSRGDCHLHKRDSTDLKIITIGVKGNNKDFFQFDVEGNGVDFIYKHPY
jgi:hypothetical protein